MASNRQSLVGVSQHQPRAPDTIPLDFHLSTASLDTLSDSVGELHTDVITPVLAFYSNVRYLIQLRDLYSTTLGQIESAAPESKERAYYEERRRNTCIAFYENVQVALNAAESAFRELDAIPRERLGASYAGVLSYERQRIDDLARKQGFR